LEKIDVETPSMSGVARRFRFAFWGLFFAVLLPVCWFADKPWPDRWGIPFFRLFGGWLLFGGVVSAIFRWRERTHKRTREKDERERRREWEIERVRRDCAERTRQIERERAREESEAREEMRQAEAEQKYRDAYCKARGLALARYPDHVDDDTLMDGEGEYCWSLELFLNYFEIPDVIVRFAGPDGRAGGSIFGPRPT
jgi:hypothetical protein